MWAQLYKLVVLLTVCAYRILCLPEHMLVCVFVCVWVRRICLGYAEQAGCQRWIIWVALWALGNERHAGNWAISTSSLHSLPSVLTQWLQHTHTHTHGHYAHAHTQIHATYIHEHFCKFINTHSDNLNVYSHSTLPLYNSYIIFWVQNKLNSIDSIYRIICATKIILTRPLLSLKNARMKVMVRDRSGVFKRHLKHIIL